MSRRSNQRKRERQKLRHKLNPISGAPQADVQVPDVRRVSTAQLFEEIERRTKALDAIFSGEDRT
jgi:hypothetical protein